MALDKLPSNLYSGNAVVVNAMPYVQYADKLKREKAAKDEAIDKYYQNLPNTLNPKGMRDQDIPGLNEKVSEIQKYWMENRDAIRKGNTPEAFNLSKKFREAQGGVEMSKNAGGTSLYIAKSKADPKKGYMFRGPEREAAIIAHEEPIWSPNYKGINLPTYDVPPPPLQQKDLIRLTADIKPGVRTSTKAHPTDKYKEIEVSTPYLEPKQLDDIQKRAATELHNNWSFEEEIKNKLSKTPEIKEKLDLVFKNNYGRLPQTEEDVAAAYLLSNMANLAETEKPVPNFKEREDLKWGRKLAFNKLTYEQSMDKIRANKEAGLPPPNTGYLSDELFDSDGEDVTVRLNGAETKRRVLFTDKVDPERLDIMIGKDLSKKKLGIEPIDIKVPDGKGGYIVKQGYYQDPVTRDVEGKNGQKASRERIKDDYINKYSSSKFKAATNTKAVEKKAGGATTFKVIDPKTGDIIMDGVDEAAANKAKAKGYNVQ
jgi:hypothetical protein